MNKRKILSKHKNLFIKKNKMSLERFVVKEINEYLHINQYTGRLYMGKELYFISDESLSQNMKISKLYQGFIEGLELIPENKSKLLKNEKQMYITFRTHNNNYLKFQKVCDGLYEEVNTFTIKGRNKYSIEKLWQYTSEDLKKMKSEQLMKISDNPEWKVFKIKIDNILEFTRRLREKYPAILGLEN